MKKITLIIAISMMSLGLMSVSSFSNAEEAKLYRHVDANGNVHYSDQPSAGAEEIKIKEVPSITIEQPKIDFEEMQEQQRERRDPNAPYYEVLKMTSPEQDGVVRNNGAVVPMAVSLTPTLSRGHYINFFLDGKLVGHKQKTVNFQVEEVEYGPHTASFNVYDDKGTLIQASDKVNFSLLHVVRKRASVSGAAAHVVINTGFPAQPKVPSYNSMKKSKQ